MEHIVPNIVKKGLFCSEFLSVNGTPCCQIVVIWEQISDHFSTHSYFAPKLRCPLWMRQTKGHVQTCLGNFGCMSLSWILHNSNEGGQVRACLGKYKHINSPFACHRLLDYGSDLQEFMLAKSCSKGKMSTSCKVNWSDIDGASPKPKWLHLQKD